MQADANVAYADVIKWFNMQRPGDIQCNANSDREAVNRLELTMTYEEYLDEVTTLMTEKYDLSDEDAIKYVMCMQAADFFTLHDDHPEMRTQERAEKDAKTIFEQKNKSLPHTPPKQTGRHRK